MLTQHIWELLHVWPGLYGRALGTRQSLCRDGMNAQLAQLASYQGHVGGEDSLVSTAGTCTIILESVYVWKLSVKSIQICPIYFQIIKGRVYWHWLPVAIRTTCHPLTIYRWLDHSLEEGSGRERLELRSVSIAVSWLLLPPEVGVNRHGHYRKIQPFAGWITFNTMNVED